MIVLGGELASEVSRRRTKLASKPPKTLMANTENEVLTPQKHTELLFVWQQKQHY